MWPAVTVEEKRAALDLVLQSRVLRRCDQLRSMLRYVCEYEFEGRGSELNEYLIGVEALGRSSSYNPAEDSIVRTSAYELRNKLAKYYTTEAPDAPVRIEIERGAYVPRFIRSEMGRGESRATALPPQRDPARDRTLQANGPPEGAPATPEVLIPSRSGSRLWLFSALALTCGLLGALLAYGYLRSSQTMKTAQPEHWTPEMEAFWKPFLANDTPLMLTYNSRLFLLAPPLDLMVRNWQTNEMSEVPNSPALEEFRRKMRPEGLLETRNYVDFGAVYSVFLLMRTVGRRQSQVLLKVANDLDWTDIFNDNIIFVGGLAKADPRLRRVLEAGDFTDNVAGIANLHPKPGEQEIYRVSHIGSNNGEKYALLSWFPGPQRGRYVMLLGSAHSELPWALAEYVTNPLSMHELMQHIRTPSGDLPDAFQVVLRVIQQSQVPVRIQYATHHVVKAPEYADEPNAGQK